MYIGNQVNSPSNNDVASSDSGEVMAILSIIFGGFSLIAFCCFTYAAPLFAIPGLILGIIYLSKKYVAHMGISIIGIALSTISLIATVIFIIFVGGYFFVLFMSLFYEMQ